MHLSTYTSVVESPCPRLATQDVLRGLHNSLDHRGPFELRGARLRDLHSLPRGRQRTFKFGEDMGVQRLQGPSHLRRNQVRPHRVAAAARESLLSDVTLACIRREDELVTVL